MTGVMGQGDCVKMSVVVGIASLWPGCLDAQGC